MNPFLMNQKSTGTAYLWLILTAGIGAHRFYITGKMRSVLWYWLLLVVTACTWIIIELCLIPRFVRKENERRYKRYARATGQKGYRNSNDFAHNMSELLDEIFGD